MIFTLVALAWQAQGLDTPIQQQPTVRSEIRRGYQAGDVCGDYRAPASRLAPCIARLLADDRISHTSSDAFAIGLNIRKWELGVRFMKIATSLPNNRLAEIYGLDGKVAAGQAEMDVHLGVAALKITQEQAFEAAGLSKEMQPASAF